jgi:hypothetical protein
MLGFFFSSTGFELWLLTFRAGTLPLKPHFQSSFFFFFFFYFNAFPDVNIWIPVLQILFAPVLPFYCFPYLANKSWTYVYSICIQELWFLTAWNLYFHKENISRRVCERSLLVASVFSVNTDTMSWAESENREMVLVGLKVMKKL